MVESVHWPPFWHGIEAQVSNSCTLSARQAEPRAGVGGRCRGRAEMRRNRPARPARPAPAAGVHARGLDARGRGYPPPQLGRRARAFGHRVTAQLLLAATAQLLSASHREA